MFQKNVEVSHPRAAWQACFDGKTLTATLSDLTRHQPTSGSVIEEFVEGFVEGFLTDWNHSPRRLNLSRLPRPPDCDVQVSVRTTANGIAYQTHGHCGHRGGGGNHHGHTNSNCMRRREASMFSMHGIDHQGRANGMHRRHRSVLPGNGQVVSASRRAGAGLDFQSRRPRSVQRTRTESSRRTRWQSAGNEKTNCAVIPT